MFKRTLALLAACLPAQAQTVVTSTFDQNSEGWTIVAFQPSAHTGGPGHIGSAGWSPLGNPGGSIRVGDVAGWTWVSAPPTFLGEQSGALAGVLRWDTLVRFADASPVYPAAAIVGLDHTLYATVDTASLVLGGWTALSFPLVAGTWRLDSYQSAQLATAEQIQDVLADVQGVYINAEFHTGTDDTNIDSVALGHPPTPCRPDLTGAGVPGQAGYGVPDGALTNDDFFYYLIRFSAGNLGVADLTASGLPGTPGYGTPDGVLSNDDFFFYLTIFTAGC